ncbi:DHH family phosphoesterase [Pedobacter sp.]|nr:DHH family phosphoesterase [Candidatus Saccharibacteria bacterium]
MITDAQKKLIEDASSIVVMQAENPDGDSLGSALALEDILSEMGKKVTLYAHVDMPKYLRYVPGWDRVTADFDTHADLAIIVDTTSDTLLSKAMSSRNIRHFLETHPVLVFDHHGEVASTLDFEHELVIDPDSVATGEMIYQMAAANKWTITPAGAEALMMAILSDSLGLTTAGTTARSIHTVASLVEIGAKPAEVEARRRLLMKKSPEILEYKGVLIGRIEYFLEGKLALIHIPWEDIQAYSDQYNPSVLVLDEMRLVEGVQVAIALKTYPDNKVTGKLRTNLPVADAIAGYFGGGGHVYAAGFRVYEAYDQVVRELVTAVSKILEDAEHDQTA